MLGMAGLDAFDADTQPKPPYRELAQVEQGVGGSEGHTVVTADVDGQAAVLEKPLSSSPEHLCACSEGSFPTVKP